MTRVPVRDVCLNCCFFPARSSLALLPVFPVANGTMDGLDRSGWLWGNGLSGKPTAYLTAQAKILGIFIANPDPD